MMKPLISVELMRELDRNSIDNIGIPSMVLVEKAATAVFEEIRTRYSADTKILILCGRGNNAADGLALARILHDHGYKSISVALASDRRGSDEFEAQLHIIGNYSEIELHEEPDETWLRTRLSQSALVIDAVLGIGISRRLSDKLKKLIRLINYFHYIVNYKVLSIDVPTGLNADTGQVFEDGEAVKADITVTLGFIKTGLLMPGAHMYVGELIDRAIGIFDEGEAFQKSKWRCNKGCYSFCLPHRRSDGHKGSFGCALIVAGDETMSGAAILAARAAYKIGAGLVLVLTHSRNVDIIKMSLPEAIVRAYDDAEGLHNDNITFAFNKSDAMMIGSGLGMSKLSKELMTYALTSYEKPKIIDAGALELMALKGGDFIRRIRLPYVITPHIKEYSRLINISICEIKKNMLSYSSMFTDEYKCISVLKDNHTVVSDQDMSFVNTYGNSGMGTGGSGDVLAGMLAGGIAQLMGSIKSDRSVTKTDAAEAHESALWRTTAGIVELHALAGDLAAEDLTEYSLTASELINYIPKAIIMQRSNDEEGYDEGKGDNKPEQLI